MKHSALLFFKDKDEISHGANNQNQSMKQLSDEVIQFFQSQGFVIVSTIERSGTPHSSCKGVVKINRNGRIYLLDLYRGKTYENLTHNQHISITAVNEHRFSGYCLKGKAKIVKRDSLSTHLMKAWEDKISSRITRRLLKNIRGEKGHPQHPEITLPHPEYLMVMEVEEVVDLTPSHLQLSRG